MSPEALRIAQESRQERHARIQAVTARLPVELRERFTVEARHELPPWSLAPDVIENLPPQE